MTFDYFILFYIHNGWISNVSSLKKDHIHTFKILHMTSIILGENSFRMLDVSFDSDYKFITMVKEI